MLEASEHLIDRPSKPLYLSIYLLLLLRIWDISSLGSRALLAITSRNSNPLPRWIISPNIDDELRSCWERHRTYPHIIQTWLSCLVWSICHGMVLGDTNINNLRNCSVRVANLCGPCSDTMLNRAIITVLILRRSYLLVRRLSLIR